MFLRKRPRAEVRAEQINDNGVAERLRRLVVLRSASGAELDRLLWTNAANGAFHFDPASLHLSVDVAGWRSSLLGIDAIELELPPGWVTDRPTWRRCIASTRRLDWIVTPSGAPDRFSEKIRAKALAGGTIVSSIELSVPIELHGVSQFDPRLHAFEQANDVADWGSVRPDWAVFQRTFPIALFPRALFSGLYRSIVFLGGSLNGYGGGLCTGMARAALERSISPTTDERTLDEILLWHGRQLSDRALLASAPWFLMPSPRRAFSAFQRDLLRTGATTRCFDIGVPKPWRADIVGALQREGHTVVPYGFRQSSRDVAEVYVYDPNDPRGSMAGDTKVTFDLKHNRYAYRGIAALDERRTTVIAVKQSDYRRGRTAILAGLASWLLALIRRHHIESTWARKMTFRALYREP